MSDVVVDLYSVAPGRPLKAWFIGVLRDFITEQRAHAVLIPQRSERKGSYELPAPTRDSDLRSSWPSWDGWPSVQI